MRLTVDGNLINYDGYVLTQAADLATSKILWNSVISTLHAEYMCSDLKNFYLGTPMKEYEYMQLHISDIFDITIYIRALAGRRVNTAMTDTRSTTINWQ
jgi:hypothetical protein